MHLVCTLLIKIARFCGGVARIAATTTENRTILVHSAPGQAPRFGEALWSTGLASLVKEVRLANYISEFSALRENKQKSTYHVGCEPSSELQESLDPFGPEIPKKSEKSFLPGSQKVWKSLSRDFPDFSDFFETFSRLFVALGPEAPGDFFSDFFWISGPEGPRDSCSSREGSQP